MFLGLVLDLHGFYTLNPKQVFCPEMGLLEAAAFFHRAIERDQIAAVIGWIVPFNGRLARSASLLA